MSFIQKNDYFSLRLKIFDSWIENLLAPVVLIFACLVPQIDAHSAPSVRTSAVQVDALCGNVACASGSTVVNPQRARKVVSAPSGVIHVVFKNSDGIWTTKSTDNAASFSSATKISSDFADAEIAASTNGTLYVFWRNTSNVYKVSRSLDGGQIWQPPVTVATATGNSAHMAALGNRLYLMVGRSPAGVFRSEDNGQTFASASSGLTVSFADIAVNRRNGTVFVQTDNPTVRFTSSNDGGVTFSPAVTTTASVYYSTSATAALDTGSYMFTVGGNSSKMVRIDTSTGVATVLNNSPVTPSASGLASVAADDSGNVVAGYFPNSGPFSFSISNDLGNIFHSVTSIAGATNGSVAINPVNGDVLTVYESGGHIYMDAYQNGLVGYNLTVAPASLGFADTATDSSSQLDFVVRNTGTATSTISNLMQSGSSAFAYTNNCPVSLPVGGSCTINVRFSPFSLGAASGAIDLQLDGVSRRLMYSGIGVKPQADLAISKTISASSVAAGGVVTYTITASNAGPSADAAAAVSDTVPAALSGVVWTCVGTGGGTCQASGLGNINETVNLPAGGSVTYTLTGQLSVNASGVVTNSATITSSNLVADPDSANNTSAITAAIIPRYTVTPVAGTGGSMNPSAAVSVLSGSTTGFSVVPSVGYSLASVNGCGGSLSGTTYTTGAIGADCSVNATFALKTYSVTGAANPTIGGSVSCSSPVSHGTTATCTATPTTDFVLTSFDGCDATNGATCTVANVTSPRTVTAHFASVRTYVGATVPSTGPSGTGTLTITGGGNTCRLDSSFTKFIAAPISLPAGIRLPQGLVQFRAIGCDVGSTVQVTATWPQTLTGYIKFDAINNQWFVPDALSVTGNTATFNVTDGGRGDDDGAADGTITDPNGPTHSSLSPIPTLNEWMVIGLTLLTAGIGMVRMRTRLRSTVL
ncbi:IPTL-CTERM sorting domain-containing protein [Acidovorax temperans]|uniref:IPTL-CTERM sorting domain-containing protein n=1 Tax=Acidovorax temperans TaxID=80878 RepID=UPI0035AE793D